MAGLYFSIGYSIFGIQQHQLFDPIRYRTGMAINRDIDRCRHRSFEFTPALPGISIRIRNGF